MSQRAIREVCIPVQNTGGGVPSSTLYCGSDSWFIAVETQSGSGSAVGSPGFVTHGLAYDSINDVIYATDELSLYTLNPSNGAATLIGTLAPNNACRALAYNSSNGTLYGLNGSNLITVNTTTAATAIVGPLNFGGASGFLGLAYNSNLNVLYALGSTSTVQPDTLVAVNMSTGQATLVGATVGATHLRSLAYDPITDALYSHNNQNSIGDSNTLFTLNMFNGTATRVGSGTGFVTVR